jgi:4-amino-4-deoxy-L-arabinose transferase-like glycosyltransferase
MLKLNDRGWVVWIGVLALLLLLPGIFHFPLIDRDEPRFSRAAVEMLERGDFFVPRFNGDYRFDKPPLTYWLMFPGLAVWGESEWVVRLPSVLSALGCGLLIFYLARRMGVGRDMAALAAMGWLSCLQVMIHGRISVADMHLCFFLVLTMLALWELRECGGGWRSRWFHVLWLAMGFGFLAKGPLALVLPLIALLCVAALERWKVAPAERRAGGLLRMWLMAVLGALVLVALWGLPALWMTRGLYFDVGIGTHVVDRGLEGFNKRKHVPLVYYPLMLPFFIAPWTSMLPRLWAGRRGMDGRDLYLAGWVLAPFLVFTFYATQLPHYILPGYPALFLLFARRSGEGRMAVWMKVAVAVPVVVFVLLGGAMWWGATRAGELDAGMAAMLFWLGGVMLLLAGASVLVMGRRYLLAVCAMVGVAGCMQMGSFYAGELHVVKRLAAELGGEVERPASVGFTEPSLVWYASQKWMFSNEIVEDADLQVVAGRRWRLDDRTLSAIWNRETPMPVKRKQGGSLDEVPHDAASVTGWSIADGSWVELWYWRNEEDSAVGGGDGR